MFSPVIEKEEKIQEENERPLPTGDRRERPSLSRAHSPL